MDFVEEGIKEENILEIGDSAPSLTDKDNVSIASLMNEKNVGLTLSCADLQYSVKLKGRKFYARKRTPSVSESKCILKGISAVFRPGRVTAVMGASGAGKTTLLSLLAGDISSAGASAHGITLRGSVYLNGSKVDLKRVHKVSGFVYQDDVMLPTMTVEEAIFMSAKLRLPKAMPEEVKLARCREIMRILDIEKCAKTPIGSPDQKGISGGERKRLALAMEMIPNPAILFLDEPTSGLDTVNAYNVVALLTELAHSANRTIIMTIHQPSSEIFHMLDDLLLLADGQVVYHGPAADAIHYFAALGHPCPLYTNPADFFFLELLGDVRRIDKATMDCTTSSSGKISALLRDRWPYSNEFKQVMQHVPERSEAKLNLAGHQVSHSSFGTQFWLLLKRAGLNVLRDPMILPVKAMQTIIIGIIIGLIYYDLNSKDLISQAQDRKGALYFIILNQFMGSSMGVLNIFFREKTVFLREHKLGYYQLPAYFLSKNLVELPYQIAFPILLVCIIYYMIGFRPEFGHFATTCCIAVLTALNGMALGTLSACLFNSINVALAFLPMALLPMIIFSGLVINTKNIPKYFSWIPYVSPTQYAYTALMRNEFQDLTIEHNGRSLTGNAVLDEMGMNGLFTVWVNALILVGTYMVLVIASYISLYIITRSKR